jgi:mono/diheme cytochrome c family protein
VPFVDRAKAIAVRKRFVAIAFVVLGALGWSGLTARAVMTTPPGGESPDAGLEKIEAWREIPADQLAAIGYIRKDNCGSCHLVGKSGKGPDLTTGTSTKSTDWLVDHFKKPSADSPDTTLSGMQLKTVAAFVTKRDDKGVDAWANAPQAPVDGAMLYQGKQCAMCHELNGVGQKNGPGLNGLSERRARDWVANHFADPPKFSPGSTMPAYKFEPQDLDRITDYLMQIPK